MNWKEFLKPDWRKIVTLLLFLGFIFFINLPWREPVVPECFPESKEPCPVPTFIIENESIFYHFIIKPLQPGNVLSNILNRPEHYIRYLTCSECDAKDFLLLIHFIIPIIIFSSYLLSCLIVWIYDMFRKVKGK